MLRIATMTNYSGFAMITAETGAPVANARMFDVSGDVVINEARIQNHYGTGNNGLFMLNAGGSLTLNNKALLTHNADGDSAAIAHMAAGSEFTINEGAEISDSYFARNGGMVLNKGGLLTMNGGKVINNRGVNSNGTFVMLHTNNARFVMNDGEICGNTALIGSGAGWGCAIYLHNSSVAEIHGGTICHNNGVRSGAICCNQAAAGAKLYITGGRIVNNVERVGALWDMENHHDVLQSNEGHFDGITGGFFTQDVTEYCTEGYYAFVVESDSEGNPTLWEVAPGWIITFEDEEGNVLQSGPVRDGNLPVFEGEIDSREGYLWFWDKELVPATEDATYKMVWKQIVAEVFVTGDESNHKGYFTSLQDAVDAAVTDDTVRILVDIPMTAKVTVTGKKITLDGNNLTITRGKLANGKWYTGTFFTVSADASLTLDGGLTVDGGNAWTYKKTDGVEDMRTAVETYTERKEYAQGAFITKDSSSPLASADMFVLKGSLVLNDTTVQNHYGANYANVIHIYNDGYLTMNEGATLTHNATTQYGTYGTVVYMETGSAFDMKGGTMSQNVGGHHGGCVHMAGGTMTVDGGVFKHNHTTCGQGSVVRLNGGDLIINGGEFFENAAFPARSSDAVGAVIDVTRAGTLTVNGGSIHDNFGYFTGGINHVGSGLTITGGTIVDNTAWGSVSHIAGHDHEYCNDIRHSLPAIITGGIFGTEIYGACDGTAEQDDAVTPKGYEEFIYKTDDEGNPIWWEVAPGWIITFEDEEGNVLQSGPVRDGNLPVFEGEVDSREGYLWFWDKELAPATEDATYKMVWKQIVAEVFVTGDESNHKGYFATLQDAVDAAETGDTVRILLDIPLTDKVTVTGKDIILDGNNLTVTRGKLENGSWYTGTLINVGKGASLTLDGNLTVDGAHAWIFKKDEYEAAFENFKVSLDRYSASFWFVDNVVGAPIATGCMISVAGSMTINDATLCNNIGGSAQAVQLASNAALTMNDGAVITHIATSTEGSALFMSPGSVFTMNGGEITDNHAIYNGMIYNNNGKIIMNGGRISDNHGFNCNGIAIMLAYGGKLIMNDGEICRNISLAGSQNGWNCAIYLHSGTSSMEMHGGYIYQNVGCTTGGIHVNTVTAKLVIDGGWVVENVSLLTEQTARPDLAASYSGINDVKGQSTTEIYGITYFTQDVNKWCTTEYISVPQDPGSMGISEDFTLWIVDKTTMDSRSEETEIFGTVTDTDTAVSRDSAYTVVFDVDHFYNRCYQSPMLHFSQDLPENTTLILQNMGRGESGYWGYTVQDQTNDIPLSAFIRMGTADEAYETPMVKPEFQIVVDFSDTTGGMPVDTLETSLYLVPADMLPTDDPDYYVSGAVRWITEEDAEGLTETVSITSVEDIALADYDCTLTSVSSDGLENTLSYTLQFREPASKWDYRELALLVTIPDLPNDAHLFLNGSTQPIRPYEDGTFIVPLGSDFDGQVTLTLASDVFPTEGSTYQATCRLYAAATIADAAPLNGQYLDRQVTCTFTSQADFASVDVIEANDKRLFTAEDRITVKVANILSSQYGIEVKLEMKGSDGTFVAMNRNYEQNGNTVTYSLNDCDPGSYRIRAIVKDETGGNVVTQESYYFIVD